MKNLYLPLIVFFCLSVFFNLNAQTIQNNDFEDWTYGIWTLEPDHWITGNQEVYPRVVPDSMPYSGDLAMKVIALPDALGAFGEAYQSIPIDYVPPTLKFQAKWEKTPSAYVGVSVWFYNEENLVYSDFWNAEEDQSPWQQIELPLVQIEPIFTHVIIRVTASVGDLVPGEGWISVDNMSFGSVNNVDELEKVDVTISPNPSSDFINIISEENMSSAVISIYDNIGKLVHSQSHSERINVTMFNAGIYNIVITSDYGRFTEKLIIHR